MSQVDKALSTSRSDRESSNYQSSCFNGLKLQFLSPDQIMLLDASGPDTNYFIDTNTMNLNTNIIIKQY